MYCGYSDKAMSVAFQTHILGASAAIPTSLRHTSAQLLRHHSSYFLLDCAEGTQMQLRRYGFPLMKINHIFISHLHGDHYLGLPGLLFTYHLLGREKTLHLYSPPGLEEIIETQYRISQLSPSFDIVYHELVEGDQSIYEDTQLWMETIAMEHRLPAFGLLIREKPSPRKIKKGTIKKHKIPIEQMAEIKGGKDLIKADGTRIPNALITSDPPPARSYAWCSDTAYTEQFLPQIQGVDLLYHEATFLHDKADIAREKTHSTAFEAASLAKTAGAKKLLLGHFSARYKELDDLIAEARKVFPNSLLAIEGECVGIGTEESEA